MTSVGAPSEPKIRNATPSGCSWKLSKVPNNIVTFENRFSPSRSVASSLGWMNAARESKFAGCRLDRDEAGAVGTAVVGAVVERHIRGDGGAQTDGLHGAQRLVVDRDGAWLAHGAFITLDQDDTDTGLAEHVGERKPCGSGTDDRNVARDGHRACSRAARA